LHFTNPITGILKGFTSIKSWDTGFKPFPALVSYQRFVEWMPFTLIPLSIYLHSCFGQCTGVSVMDSTKIQVCHNRRIKMHKVFQNIGKRGKTSVDWFFGLNRYIWFVMTWDNC
jgi:hypothetical protein